MCGALGVRDGQASSALTAKVFSYVVHNVGATRSAADCARRNKCAIKSPAKSPQSTEHREQSERKSRLTHGYSRDKLIAGGGFDLCVNACAADRAGEPNPLSVIEKRLLRGDG